MNVYPQGCAVNQSFPPLKRLRCKNEFSQVFKASNHRFKVQYFQLIAATQIKPNSRLGLVIPKKMLKKAVHRNRLKRLIRDHFRRFQTTIPCDVIIALKQKVDPDILYSKDINNTINDLLERLEVYCMKSKRKSDQHCLGL